MANAGLENGKLVLTDLYWKKHENIGKKSCKKAVRMEKAATMRG